MDNPGELFRLCRLCLVKDQVKNPIFEEQGDIRQIFLKISSCLPVKVSRDDKLPKQICDGCSNKLDLLYEFWNTSANAEKTLLSWLGQAGVKDADETISAVAQQIAKPAETQVKQEALEDGHATSQAQAQDGYGTRSLDEDAKDESEAPPPKRARRTAAVKAQISITPESDDDDDMDSAEAMTKVEDESDDSDGEDKDPSYSEVPGTSADDQPGPSGVGKDGVEAPAKLSKSLRTRLAKLQCYVCGKSFATRPQIVNHYKYLTINVTVKCNICQCFFSSKEGCEHNTDSKEFHCDFCGERLEEPSKFHKCFHLYAKTDYSMRKRFRKERKRIGDNIKLKRGGPKSKGTPRKKVKDIFEDVEEEVVVKPDIDTIRDSTENPDAHCNGDANKDEALDSDNIDDTDMCIYCNKQMPTMVLGKHEEWHRRNDKKVKRLTEIDSKRPSKNSESLCSFCGVFKPSNKLRRHEYVDHIKKFVRKVCDVCGIFTCPTYIKEHMRTHDAVQGFKCEVCGKAFFRKKALSRHRLVHSDVAQYACAVCGKLFKIKFNLRVHMRTHEDIKPFQCSVCKKTFTTKQWRDNHMKTHGIVGNKIKPFAPNVLDERDTEICDVCSAVLKPEQVSHHLNIKTINYCDACNQFFGPEEKCQDPPERNTYHCIFCKGKLGYDQLNFHRCFHKRMEVRPEQDVACFAEQLTEDIWEHINKKVLYYCGECEDLSGRKGDALQCKHPSDVKTYYCKICQGKLLDTQLSSHQCFRTKKKFPKKGKNKLGFLRKRDSESKVQLRPINEETDVCVFCSLELPLRHLAEHEDLHRLEERKEETPKKHEKTKESVLLGDGICCYCGRTLMRKDLKLHEYYHARNKKKYISKTVICQICGISTKSMKTHKAVHSDERKFSCDLCGKTFKIRRGLRKHYIVHSNEVGKHKCPTCGKAFKVNGTLKVHMRSHEAVKPFECSICLKTFTTKQWRDNHMKTH